METYSSELLKGVSPLIFVVDSIFNFNTGQSSSVGKNAVGSSAAFKSFFQKLTMHQTKCDNVPQQQQNVQSITEKFKTPEDTIASILALDPQTVGVGGTVVGKGPRTLKAKSKSSSRHPSPPPHRGFFARSNIVPVSHRHAFPPSKDPKGTKNVITRLNANLSKRGGGGNNNNGGINSSNVNSPEVQAEISSVIGGILPSGWMEKHLHALPSVLLIVTVVDLSRNLYEQAQLEQHLSNTLETLRSSCAKKRDCPVHLVCLIQDKTDKADSVAVSCGSPSLGGHHYSAKSDNQVEIDRLATIKTISRLSSSAITAMHVRKKDSSGNSGDDDEDSSGEYNYYYVEEELRKLQKSIREASMSYYLAQVRRCKKKHSHLHHGKFTDLLPVAARYCFKIGVFYEFQMHDDHTRAGKSVKYWAEAYQNVLDYYRYLQGCYYLPNQSIFKKQSSTKAKAIVLSGGGGDPKKLHTSTGGEAINHDMGRNAGNDGEPPRNVGNLTHSRNVGDNLQGVDEDHPPPLQPMSPPSDSVEVALVYGPKTDSASPAVDSKSPTPEQQKNENSNLLRTRFGDMIHQCRKVADWLNVKLLLMAYGAVIRATSESKMQFGIEEELASISLQISRHCQVFLSKPYSLCYGNDDGGNWEEDDGRCTTDPAWHFWQYTSQQRLILYQFMQRIPTTPNVLDSLNTEERKQCLASVHSASAGESLLKLRLAIQREKRRLRGGDLTDALKRVNNSGESEKKQRFVGSLGSADLIMKFQEESKRDHSGEKMKLQLFFQNSHYERRKLFLIY